jgi:alkanesulfonate monooxygenase SsuD/methylene tetrahydromethanopterin reductase-like flavin-dependent oxidoreductase (luciferase family)
MNVLNVPLRSPAVTARAAASLDLLSAGRLILALGAGAYWDAIEAMDGHRLAPGEAVSALSEAIDVVRRMLDVDDESPLSFVAGTITWTVYNAALCLHTTYRSGWERTDHVCYD